MFHPLGMTRWLKNVNIRNKIIIITIPLVVLPLLVTGYVSNLMYTDSIIRKTVQSISDNSRLIVTRIQGMLQNAESCANTLTLNLNRFMDEEGEPELAADPRYASLLTNQLSFALLMFPDVDSAAFVDNMGKVYATQAGLENNGVAFQSSDIAEQLQQSSGDNRWFPMQRRDFLTRSPDQTVLTVGKKVSDILTGRTLGWLVINIDERQLSRIFPDSGPYTAEVDWLVDADGRVVSAAEPEQLLQPVGNASLREWIANTPSSAGAASGSGEPFREGGMLAVRHELPKLGLDLVSQVPVKQLTKDTDKITWFIVGLIACCLLLVLSGAGLLSRTISTPVVRLTRTMRKVQQGSLDHTFDVKGKDEIGLLGEGFNGMIARIRGLLRQVGQEQRQKREYELALIQAQIKPHFLYNTLDVIYALSGMGRNKDVQKTTKALADYYRIVLSKGREIITLGDELQNVRDYLAIQRMRYADVFDYRIEVPSDIHAVAILKLTLQPLVENAIYHGLKPANRYGLLVITGERQGETVRLTVKDDGVGMAPVETLEPQGTNAAGTRTSFGLQSVRERIRLYFGEPYGVEIVSAPDQGTEITISLPADAPPERPMLNGTGGGEA
ncbi:sensor histidine kinase [Cohnella sp. GCM10027633]|uniref:cache domain-containing sensor histidine kinase n=1 Tax=unclassified Cohnella TaxID=2636738 RepID=UPI003642F550